MGKTDFALCREFGKNKPLADYGFSNPVIVKQNRGTNMKTEKAPARKMHKVEDAIFKFEKEGDQIEGKLIAVQETSAFGNPVYKLENDGKSYAIFATAILQRHMASVEIGKWVKIVFIGTIPNSNPKLNPIKNFDVFVED